MNGRLYNAKLHRFLQPDNYVQDPSNTQNYNRYGYVLNNPLKYTDPSGELSFKSIGKWIEKNANDVFAGVAIAAGIILVATSYGVQVGYGLISLGVSHFVATYQKHKETGDWNTAPKSTGIIFDISFSTDFGYNNSNDKPSGITQNEPVVKPVTVEDNQTPMNNWKLSKKVFGKANEIGHLFQSLRLDYKQQEHLLLL